MMEVRCENCGELNKVRVSQRKSFSSTEMSESGLDWIKFMCYKCLERQWFSLLRSQMVEEI